MNNRLKAVLAGGIALIGAAALSPQNARASGFFADVLRPVIGDANADGLDNMNRGHIFEHGVAVVSNYFLPGSGVVLEGVWTAQDIRNAWQNGQLTDEDAATVLAAVGESLD